MSKFGDLLGGKTSAPEPPARESFVEEKPKRARNEDGHFIADDPSTPENCVFSRYRSFPYSRERASESLEKS